MSKEDCNKCLEKLEWEKSCEIKGICLQATAVLQEKERKDKQRIADLEKQLAEKQREILDKDNKIANLCYKVSKEAQNALDNFKRIKELETQLADAEEHIDNLELQLREQYQLVDEKDKKITRLREHKKVDCQTIQHYSDELALTEKALKLACEDLWCMSVWENTKEEVIQDYIEHLKTKAKELLKDE